VPDYLDHARLLVERARRYSEVDLMEVMDVSVKIAALNLERFQRWRTPFTTDNARQALLAFKGDVYGGLAADSLSSADFEFAQGHLRILSGLYGLLRPLDLMQPYRLEMGRRIDNERGKNLYEFWATIITEGLNQQLQVLNSETLINLASNEYFKAVKPKLLQAQVITPEFKDYKNGSYKVMGVYAKRARGLMSRYIIQQRITEPEAIKAFAQEGYSFNARLTTSSQWVFSRRQ
jgi:cytoplasmic iron level regulating protein YaaA (DUF328/UPF0246 family)